MTNVVIQDSTWTELPEPEEEHVADGVLQPEGLGQRDDFPGTPKA
jgi:hypothetical protein